MKTYNVKLNCGLDYRTSETHRVEANSEADAVAQAHQAYGEAHSNGLSKPYALEWFDYETSLIS